MTDDIEVNAEAANAIDRDLMTHIDDWLAHPSHESEGVNYAKFVLRNARLPAFIKLRNHSWMEQFKLFCTFNGSRYRCTGASRLGDIWLTPYSGEDSGQGFRVMVDGITEWSDKPEYEEMK